MFKSVLVANRGEIACRVFRTARAMGIRTIAVYSEADADALHVREADEAVLIGPAAARESYLVAEKVLQAAKDTGAEAIHPGYGFLSENADFAEAVMAAGIIWIGPKPDSIRAMGLKDAAKKLMIEAGVPVTPGYQGEDQSDETLTAEANRIGFPVLIKAVAGGGGKGMKKVDRAEDFADGLASARREGQSSFGDPRVLIESYITRPRHIEVQVFGDSHGTVVHLNERDCSLQRRHQKVIEEAPAPGMDQATRDAVTAAAVRAAKAVNYQGAGTIEFIADASDGLKADRIWFMEMNTRLQVEHPVTEAITGVDLVEWQFRVAAGEPIPLKQDEIGINGWAMEARLYAEDPANGFLPSIGRLEHFVLPGDPRRPYAAYDVRIDTGVMQGGEVSQFYDPMIAKLIVHGNTREAAAEALADAAGDVEVWPVKTNAAFLVNCLEHPRFVSGDVDTGFIAAEEAVLTTFTLSDHGLQGAAREVRFEDGINGVGRDPFAPWESWTEAAGLRLNASPSLKQTLFVDGVRTVIEIDDAIAAQHSHFEPERGTTIYFESGAPFRVSSLSPRGAAAGPASDGSLRAPMPGKIVAAPAVAGDTVAKGAPIVVLEAMKMEHALVAPFDGVVQSVSVVVGDQVGDGVVLAVVTPVESLP
ncbi:biotin carboxylase N-terminal domain-containing protein [Brevundimonas sp. M20]|uniref:ATP-binding protein n=1 Tax=Brevundimonas sp. M20 TaxID=2591463 RepID=UPI0011465238|nr:biotin carboxylase N-terminal domain-containing protein [Brevundimonas sp. M20]QDH73911.1 ATP-grasp domain-containing protein [Brevundimonas sp. M20]